jgi:hypothetical protein
VTASHAGFRVLSLVEYVNETRAAVSLTDVALGVVKSGLFGVLIALAGCLRGMQCGRSASAVGPPKWLRDSAPDPKIRTFLTRGGSGEPVS